MNVRDKYGFSGTIEQAILHEIDGAPGYHDGEIESMKAQIKAMKEMMARFAASKISDAEGLNDIVGWSRYLNDK